MTTLLTNHASPRTTAVRRERTGIDMLRPLEVRRRLQVDEAELLRLVNSGELAAYRLGGHVRFRAPDVEAFAVRK